MYVCGYVGVFNTTWDPLIGHSMRSGVKTGVFSCDYVSMCQCLYLFFFGFCVCVCVLT